MTLTSQDSPHIPQRRIKQRAEVAHGRIVDPHVDPAELHDRPIRQPLHSLGISDVGGHGDRLHPTFAAVASHILEPLSVTGRHDQAGALLGETQRGGRYRWMPR